MKRILRTTILLLIRILGARRASTSRLSTATTTDHNPHILLVRPDHLGDMLLVTPILQALSITSSRHPALAATNPRYGLLGASTRLKYSG